MKSAQLLHFAHGNGFPSSTYKQLLERLRIQFDCIDIDKIGHNHTYPVTDNWRCLVDEIIHSIETQANHPVVAVGHSLGGVLSFMASVERPELFKAIILLDAPLISRVKSSVIQLSKKFGFIDAITPASRTRRRRKHWQTRLEALSYLKNKKLFQHFTTECLNDYIDYGLSQDEIGFSLRFDSEIEYQIYRTIPHVLPKYRWKSRIPTALIYGAKSSVINRFDLHYMKQCYGIDSYKIPGTHMFPMEYPAETARLIEMALHRLGIK